MMLLLILIPLVAGAIAFVMPDNKLRPWLLPLVGATHLWIAAWLLPQGDQWLFGRWLAIDPLSRLFVAVISLSEIAPAALQQHITWGVLLAVLVLYGLGKWTLDCGWIRPRLERRLARAAR